MLKVQGLLSVSRMILSLRGAGKSAMEDISSMRRGNLYEIIRRHDFNFNLPFSYKIVNDPVLYIHWHRETSICRIWYKYCVALNEQNP